MNLEWRAELNKVDLWQVYSLDCYQKSVVGAFVLFSKL